MGAPSFHDVSFPADISKGAVYGPSFSTIVITTAAGVEQRVAQWSMGRYKGSISLDVLTLTQTNAFIAFFHARMGKAYAFRFKDWSDYTAADEPLYATGIPTVQLTRTYTSGPVTYVRPVYAPVASPAITLKKNGSAFLGFTVDTTTGLLSLTALNTKTITGITQAAQAVVTVGSSHGFAAGDEIYFSGVAGMVEINGLVGAVISTASTTVTVALATTGFTAYSSGGTAAKYLTTSDTLTWSGQFDNVVRFDTDEMALTQEDVTYRSWSGVPIVEVRGTGADLVFDTSPPLDPLTRADLQLYLRSDQVSGADLASVATIPDLSTFARNATQSTTANKPVLHTTGSNLTPNGTRTVVFDGVDDFVSGTFPSLANTNGYTVYLMVKELALTTGGGNVQMGFASAGFEVALRSGTFAAYPAEGDYGMRGGGLGVAPRVVFGPTGLGWQILRGVWNPPAGSGSSGNMVLYVNGVQNGSGQQWWGDVMSTGYNISGSNISMQAAFAACLVFTSAHDAATGARIEAFLESVLGSVG
jgi:uncharacterized protein (TIGR02217 family)